MKPLHLGTVLLLLALSTEAPAQQSDAERRPATLSSIIIYTTQMKVLADFYEQGLELAAPDTVLDNHIGYWLDDNYVGFEPADETTRIPGRVSAWFEVGDIGEAYARLVRLGATGQMKPERQPWGDLHATVLDPDGNLLGLIETAEGR